MVEILKVGGLTIEFDKAHAWVKRYLQNEEGWAYPAYDSYPGSGTPRLTEVDLLAMVLPHAYQKPVASFYTLHRLLPKLNLLLDDGKLSGPLGQAEPETLAAVARLFSVLDDGKTPHVSLVKLSKVLHRKRPELIPLYDQNLRRVYFDLGMTPRLKRDSGRNWEDYVLAYASAVKEDLHSQADKWDTLASLAPNTPITPLRALDIVGWGLGELRNQPKELRNDTFLCTRSVG